MLRGLVAGLLMAVGVSTLPACATYSDDLVNGQKAFEASEHERALAIFRVLEPDLGQLSLTERGHYAYLRGMTDYRIGYKADARHWLALAGSIEQQAPGSLPPEWAKRLGDSLKELNETVYTAGIASLTDTAEATKAKASDEDTPPPPDTRDTPKTDTPKADAPKTDAPTKKDP
jgi:hypothetical protein